MEDLTKEDKILKEIKNEWAIESLKGQDDFYDYIIDAKHEAVENEEKKITTSEQKDSTLVQNEL